MKRKKLVLAGLAVLFVVVLLGVLYEAGVFKTTEDIEDYEELVVPPRGEKTLRIAFIPLEAKNAWVTIEVSSDHEVTVEVLSGNGVIYAKEVNGHAYLGELTPIPGRILQVKIINNNYLSTAHVEIKYHCHYEK